MGVYFCIKAKKLRNHDTKLRSFSENSFYCYIKNLLDFINSCKIVG